MSSAIFDTSQSLETSGSYNGGRIVRIMMVNFMTYEKMELIAGPGLNLIIGPNGSGKSSIVCAICLALAGRPTFTGRRMNLIDFIKHGRKQASVEIELDNPFKARNLIIKRVIHANGSSQYFMNNSPTKEQAVEKEVSGFNIQVNNLCQFLPQEKVSEFSRMNSVQLLENMQQAVGDQDLFKNHRDLKDLTTQCIALNKEIKAGEEHVVSEQEKNKRIEAEVKTYEEIQNYIITRNTLKEKLSVLVYREAYGDMKDQEQKKKELEKQEKEIEESLDPIKNQLQRVNEESLRLQSKIKKTSMLCDSTKSEIIRASNKLSTIDNEVLEAQMSLEHKIKERSEQEKKIKNIEKVIEIGRSDYEKLLKRKEEMTLMMPRINSDMNQVIEHMNDKEVSLESTGLSVKHKIHQKQLFQKELDKISEKEHMKLEALKKLDLDTYKTVLFLKDNQHMFKKNIYGPVLLVLDVPNEHDTKFIENHIAFRDMLSFICEDKDDLRLFVTKVRQEMNLRINAALAPDKLPSSFRSAISVNELRRKYSFSCYLKDLFKAPDPVVSFLCTTYKIHETPVGSNMSYDQLQFAIDSNIFLRFYSQDTQYSMKRSRYGNKNSSVGTTALRKPTILKSVTDTSAQMKEIRAKIEELKSEILESENEIQQLKNEKQILQSQLDELRIQKKEYSDLTTAIRSRLISIKEKERVLQFLKNEVFDINEEKKTLAKLVENKNNEKMVLYQKISSLLEENCLHLKEILRLKFHHYSCSLKNQDLKNSLKEKEELYNHVKDECVKAQQLYQHLRQTAKRRLTEASIVCKMTINRNSDSELAEKYGHLPGTIKDIQSEINRVTARINSLGQSDKSVFDEHVRRSKDIKNKQRSLKDAMTKLNSLKEEIETKKLLWLTPLKALIDKISKTFAKYFENMGCAGEINLKTGDDPNDFFKYGLSILVKFRKDGSLQELSHAHHSGGECSVSTIIFILSLQQLTEVPFRCVDEINQGMDALNERRIFDLVSLSAGTSQYFLLTPKLLPDLTYPAQNKVHIIHNAPAMQEKMKFDINTMLDVVKKKKQTAQ